MPALAALLYSAFGGVVTWLVQYVTKRVAVTAVAATVLIASLAAIMVAFNAAVSPLVAQAFSTQYGAVFGLAFPPIAGTCMATITTVWLACATYRLQVMLVKLSAGS